MIEPFSYQGSAARIVFGAGRRNEIASWVEALGCRRALVLTTARQTEIGTATVQMLGPLAAGLHAEAAMHTPVEVTEIALQVVAETGADCLVAVGGGSTVGLSKALAYRMPLKQIAVPTTYAGSEVTPILGQTANQSKTTLRDDRVLPDVVIYDPELSVGLPVPISVASALNALAHAAESLYARDRNPISKLVAIEGMRAIRDSLPGIIAAPSDLIARAGLLYGAWLCGTVLGSVGMALHHKICHTLGGTFGLPHAETHAVMLPHTIGYNAQSVPALLEPVAELFGGAPGAALHAFCRRNGAPMSLSGLGMAAADLDLAAEIATRDPYWNPREIDRSSIRALLQDAFDGRAPR